MKDVALVEQENKMTARGGQFVALAETLTIEDDTDYKLADGLISEGVDFIKNVKLLLDPHIKRAHEAHRALTSDRKRLTEPVENATKTLGKRMGAYNHKRIQEENDRLEAERAKAQAEQEESCIKIAADLEKSGETAAADAVMDMAADPVEVPETPDKPVLLSRTKYRTDYISKVVVPNLVPREYLIVDEAKIQKIVRAMKGEIKIPGIQIDQVQVPIRKGAI